MFVAVLLYLVHRWATDKTAVTSKIVIEAAFAILVIALLDQGETEPVAKGFAWLFLAGAAYTAIPTIAKASGTTGTTTTWTSVLGKKAT